MDLQQKLGIELVNVPGKHSRIGKPIVAAVVSDGDQDKVEGTDLKLDFINYIRQLESVNKSDENYINFFYTFRIRLRESLNDIEK